MRTFILVALFVSLLLSQALTPRQLSVLKIVKDTALRYPNKKGETFEDTAMAICLVESDGGGVEYGDKQLLKKGIKKGSYGMMQVRLDTAKFVAKVFHLTDVADMSDADLIEMLMFDDYFNAKIAVLYLVWLSENSESYFEMVSRYNGGKVNYPYFNRVKKKIKLLKRYKI
jgi:soluble lytic murein transglycosylase-like protein